MTTTVTTASTGPLTASGVTPLPFTFQAISAEEIEVTRDGVTAASNTYSVSLNDDGTGEITPLASWGSDTIYIYSMPTYQQDTEFNKFGAFYPDLMNGPLDRMARSIVGLKHRMEVMGGPGDGTLLRQDLAASAGASLMGYIASGAGSITRTTQTVLREGRQSTAGFSSFAAAAAASAALWVPAGTTNLGSDVTLTGDISIRQHPNSVYTGSGKARSNDHLGYFYTADFDKIRFAETKGTIASPDATNHPVMYLARHTSAAYGGQSANATLVLYNNKWSTGADSRAQALFAEVVARASSPTGYNETIRTQAIVPAGLTTKNYALIALAQNEGDGINNTAVEAEVYRGGGQNNVDPLVWANGQLLDVAVLGTVRFGGTPSAMFAVNGYNTVKSLAGYLVMNSAKAQGGSKAGGFKLVENAFVSLEDDITSVVMARGTGIYSILNVPGTIPIVRARNGADNASHNILHYSPDNVVHIGAEAIGVKLYGALFTVGFANAANDAAAASAGVAVNQLYRNGSVVQTRVA